MTDRPNALERVEIRELYSAAELAPLCDFERRIWGADVDAVSLDILVATIDEGGVALGAYTPADDASSSAEPEMLLVGAAYGFPSREAGVLHSHYLAVDPSQRRSGLGAALKLRQRDWCLRHGYTAMRWTYDPLQLPNAHLNLRTLQAVGVRYHVNHYGQMGGLNGSLPSDRVTVRWDLTGRVVGSTETVQVAVLPVSADDIAASNDTAASARAAAAAAR
jgi:predicted GNAT superfamily acetyltransferase